MQYQPKGGSRKCPLHFSLFEWGRLLEHSFLEHLCLVRVPVTQGNFYMQRLLNTSSCETFPGSNFGCLLLEQIFVWHLAAFPIVVVEESCKDTPHGVTNDAGEGIDDGMSADTVSCSAPLTCPKFPHNTYSLHHQNCRPDFIVSAIYQPINYQHGASLELF